MSRFLQELKRRKVFRVAAAYLVAAWVLLQVTDLLVPTLALPDWTTRLVLLLLLIGFIPALILSWAYNITPAGITRDPQDESEADAGRIPSRGLASGLLIVGLAVAGYWYATLDQRWAQNEAFPRIEALADEGRWEDAHALAREVARRLPGNEELAQIWPTIGFITTIESEPPGAIVSRRPYRKPDSPLQELGQTPLSDIVIPFGPSVFRLELDGRPPLERIIGGETGGRYRLAVNESPATWGAQIAPGALILDAAETIPVGMVRVPGHVTAVNGEETELNPFYIGRYEVTNAEFKQFVDAGGYSEPRYWAHEILLNGEVLPFERAMDLFVDRSGRPGPATWTAGSFPDGEERYPVAGISWYEAAAYARYLGRELPTLHHWRRAHASGALAWQLPLSNVESDSTTPVGVSPGMDWTGAYDMVGNVREWCFNAIGGQRVIVGGSFDGPSYLVQQSIDDPGSLPPLDRSAANGMRLMHAVSEPRIAGALRAPVLPTNIPEIGEPVADDVFAVFLRQFDYDRVPLDPLVEERIEFRHWTRQRISVVSDSAGNRLPLYLFLPGAPATSYQAIVYWPTISALIADNIEQEAVQLDFALRNGRAVLYPVIAGALERRRSGFPDWSTNAGRDLVIQQIKDLRRSVDFLESRPDINNDAIAFYGFSWGGRLGAIALAVEPRFKVGILNQAGLQHLAIPETSVLNYLPRVTVPVLQFNGRYDSDFRFESSARPFFELLGTNPSDKKHVVEDWGHFVPRNIVIGETLDWLDSYLGPAN